MAGLVLLRAGFGSLNVNFNVLKLCLALSELNSVLSKA
jgi:hypothetical protein